MSAKAAIKEMMETLAAMARWVGLAPAKPEPVPARVVVHDQYRSQPTARNRRVGCIFTSTWRR